MTLAFRRWANTLGALFAAVAILALSSCSNSDTTTVESSTTTSAKQTTSSVRPPSAAYEGLVETLKQMGISEAQARCVVEKMDDVTADFGDTSSPEDSTQIEKLLEDCKIVG